MLAVITALLIPLAAINATMRNIASAGHAELLRRHLRRAIRPLAGLHQATRRQVDARTRVVSRPGARNRAPFICALASLPLALAFILVAIPEAKSRGASLWLPVALSLIIPVLASAAGRDRWRDLESHASRGCFEMGERGSRVSPLRFFFLRFPCDQYLVRPRNAKGRHRDTAKASPPCGGDNHLATGAADWKMGAGQRGNSWPLRGIPRPRADGGAWMEARRDKGPSSSTAIRSSPSRASGVTSFIFGRPIFLSEPRCIGPSKISEAYPGESESRWRKKPDQWLPDYHASQRRFRRNAAKPAVMAGLAFEPWQNSPRAVPRPRLRGRFPTGEKSGR
jgi:hypothetical protein